MVEELNAIQHLKNNTMIILGEMHCLSVVLIGIFLYDCFKQIHKN